MTEFEIQELQMMRWEMTQGGMELLLALVTLYLTLIFAYLAAAHFAGANEIFTVVGKGRLNVMGIQARGIFGQHVEIPIGDAFGVEAV